MTAKYFDMRAAAKCENCGGTGCDKCLAKETPLDGGKVVENPAKIKDMKDIPIERSASACECEGKGCDKCLEKTTPLDGGKVIPAPADGRKDMKDIPIEKVGGETKVCSECGGKGCEVCEMEGGKFKKGEGAACTADSETDGPGLQSFNNSVTNGGPAGSPNANQLAPVLGPKVSYYDMRPKKTVAAVEIIAGESPLRQVRQMLTQAASRIEQLRNSPEAKFEEGEAAALAKAEDLVEKARKILFDAQVDPPARKIDEEAPAETAVEPPVAEPAPAVEPAKV